MLTEGTIAGHRSLGLENELLAITVLPDKGADLYEFVYKPRGVDLLMRTPSGLNPPRDYQVADFLENYEGGWQELFPNAGEPCSYRGVRLPFHGEVALLPWSIELLHGNAHETVIVLSVQCRLTPFALRRRMRLRAGSAALEIETSITNTSEVDADFVWGHHLVLGGDFIERGCRLDVPAGVLLTPEDLYEPATAKLAPGQRTPWPLAHARAGGQVDLRSIPGPEAHSHDDVYLTNLACGHASVTNPRLGLRFSLDWEESLFPYIILWQPFGGAHLPPLTGIYGLGLEPWTSRYNLEDALRHGEARRLRPGEELTTSMRASVTETGF